MTFAALVRKDLLVEVRGRDAFAALLTVAILVALVGNVSFSGLATSAVQTAAVLWTAVAFGAQVGLARSFVVEREQGTLDGLLASPVSAAHIFWSKLVANLLVLLLVSLVTLFAAALFFNLPLDARLFRLLALLVPGAVGIALVTTLAAAIAVHGRNWILLVPLLALPALFPVLAVAVPGSALALADAPFTAILPNLRVVFAYDLVMAAAAWVLVPFVLEP